MSSVSLRVTVVQIEVRDSNSPAPGSHGRVELTAATRTWSPSVSQMLRMSEFNRRLLKKLQQAGDSVA